MTTTEYYEPRGAARELWHCQAPEVLISGPAGTGKSIAALFKLHYLATHIPHLRGLILRQTRESLTETALVTFESKVLPPGHPALDGSRRDGRHVYLYPNGAELAVRGLRQGGSDQAARVMSAEFDVIYVQEAIELQDGPWEDLTTRLRNGRLPFQQLMGDTNPGPPTHWLKRRCDAGRCVLLESRHEDNPLLWDGRQWTTFAHNGDGTGYLDRLDALTGPRYWRLRHGRWVQAEGVVFPDWDPAVHVIDRFDIPESWPRYLSVDFGYVHPFVCQWWCEDADGRLYCYREIHHSQRLTEDHARDIRTLSRHDPLPAALVCDHDAAERAVLEAYLGWPTTPAVKVVGAGIQAVQARLRRAGDGRPRLFYLRDSLVERDAERWEAKLPCSLPEEFDSYVWDERLGRHKGEEPLKRHDDGLDAARYIVASLDLGGLDAEEAGDDGGLVGVRM